MKAMWVLLMVCLAACVGKTPGGADAAPDMAKVDALDVVADLAGEVGQDTQPLPDTLDTVSPPDTLDLIDVNFQPDTTDSIDTAPPPDTLDTVDTDIPCNPDCDGKECGDDGCGGSCGACEGGGICGDGACVECWDWNDVDWDGCNDGVIAEWLVNQVTGDHQEVRGITGIETGGFVIIWDSMFQDGFMSGVFGRIYGALGQPQGDEFQVNTWTIHQQWRGRVAPLPGGGFVVVWESFKQDDDYSYGVFGQAFGPNGEKLGPERQVNVNVEGGQRNPDIACRADGRCLAVWLAGGSDDNVMGRWFEPEFVPSGGDFLLNDFWSGDQSGPKAFSTPDGGMILTWAGAGPGDGDGVFLRRIDPDGEFLGAETLVNTNTTGTQAGGEVAVMADGSFLVVWDDWESDGSEFGIVARLFDQDGEPAGTEFVVNETIVGSQIMTDIVKLNTDTCLVVWCAPGDSFGRLLTSSGSVDGPEFKLGIHTDDWLVFPMGTGLSGGGAAVVWSTEGVVSQRDVVAQIFSADGEKVAPVL